MKEKNKKTNLIIFRITYSTTSLAAMAELISGGMAYENNVIQSLKLDTLGSLTQTTPCMHSHLEPHKLTLQREVNFTGIITLNVQKDLVVNNFLVPFPEIMGTLQ